MQALVSKCSEQQLRQPVDGQPGQRAHDRTVDPDKLQVTADVQFDAPAGFLGVAALDGVGNNRSDLDPILGDQVLGGTHDPVVDLVPQIGVIA